MCAITPHACQKIPRFLVFDSFSHNLKFEIVSKDYDRLVPHPDDPVIASHHALLRKEALTRVGVARVADTHSRSASHKTSDRRAGFDSHSWRG